MINNIIKELMIMTKLLVQDIMNRAGIDPKNVLLIRHSKSDSHCKLCIDNNMLKEYMSVQKTSFSKDYDYWMAFISGEGTSAILEGFYKVNGSQPISPELMPEGYPIPDEFEQENHSYFDLEKLDCLKEYENRLIIDWGKSTRKWHQKATNDKEILAIQSEKKIPFSSYEDIILSYPKLKEIIDESHLYSDWHAALKSVYGVYLIVDKISGKQYVGSAYGNKGILQRWTEYVKTGHGGNQKLKELLKEDPNRYKSFQFSILQVLPPNLTNDEVISVESKFKDKLLTREFGFNEN